MPYKVLIDGVPVECATAQEAQELAKLHAAQGARIKPVERVEHGAVLARGKLPGWDRASIARRAPIGDAEKDFHAIAVLKAMEAESKSSGIGAQAIVDIAKLSSAKGSGSFMTYVRGRLLALNFPVSRVFSVERKRGGRRWQKGPQIRQAIAALEELAAEQHARPNGGGMEARAV